MNSKPLITLERLLYLAILLAAAWLRLSRLAETPLSDPEARTALVSASLAGEASLTWPAEPASEPAYQSLTGLLFSLLNPDDGLARLIPALAGAALVLSPALGRGSLGRANALLASGLLALSPALWTASRSAGGHSLAQLALLAILLTLGSTGEGSSRRLSLMAVALGVLAASGPAAYSGLAGVALGTAAYGLMQRFAVGTRPRSAVGIPWDLPRRMLAGASNEERRNALILGGVTLLVCSTGFGFIGAALPGMFESLGLWVGGWGQMGSMSAGALLASLVLYEPLIAVFGLAGVALALRGRIAGGQLLLSWLIGALALVLIYPARQPGDLAWLVLPAALLAAGALGRLIERLELNQDRWLTAGFAAASVVLMAFAYLQLAAYAFGLDSLDVQFDLALRLGLALSALGVVVMALIVLGLGWSWNVALNAGGLACLVALLLATFAGGWSLNFGASAASARELWRQRASTPGLRMLSHSLATISDLEMGRPQALPIRIEGAAPAALAWELRRFPLAGASTASPAVVIAPEGSDDPGLEAEYLGQSFGIAERQGWEGALPGNLAGWYVRRQAPVEIERWVLYVRADLAGIGLPGQQELEPES